MSVARWTRTAAVTLLAAVTAIGWWAPAAAAEIDDELARQADEQADQGNEGDPPPATDGSDRKILDRVQARDSLDSDVERCEQLGAESPPDASRSDIAALEEWARCAEMLEDFGFSDDMVEDAWFGSAARTQEGFAITAYEIHYDEGGFWRIDRKMQGSQMSFAWTLGVTSLRLGTWAFDWAANSRLTDIVASIPAAVRGEIESTRLVEVLLMPLAVMVVFATAAFAFLRRRTAKAASTLLWFGAVLVVATLLLANPDGWHRFVLEFRQALGSVAGIPADTTAGVGSDDDVDAASAVAPLLSAAVHDPWEQLNWGGAVPAGDCEARAAEVLTRRPSATADWPREHMANCPPGAERHSHNPTTTRMIGTFIVAGGQVMLGLIILSIAMIALGSEISLAIAFSALPLVAVIAMFPGGRKVASWWGATTAYGAVGLVLSLLLLNIIRVVLNSVMVAMSNEHVPMISRFMVWFVVVLVIVWRRKDIKGLTKSISAKLGGGSGSNPAAIGAAGAIGAVGGAAAMSQFAGGPGGMAMAGMSARAARNAGSSMLGGAAQLATARNSEGRTARLLGSTKAAGGAGLAMGSALATAQALGGHRNAARSTALQGPVSQDVTQQYAEGRHAKRMIAARAPSTTPQQLVGLAGTGDKRLMGAIAEHANTPETMRSDIARGMSAQQIQTRAELGHYGEYVPLHPDKPRAAAPPPSNGAAGSAAGAAHGAGAPESSTTPPRSDASAGQSRRAAQHSTSGGGSATSGATRQSSPAQPASGSQPNAPTKNAPSGGTSATASQPPQSAPPQPGSGSQPNAPTKDGSSGGASGTNAGPDPQTRQRRRSSQSTPTGEPAPKSTPTGSGPAPSTGNSGPGETQPTQMPLRDPHSVPNRDPAAPQSQPGTGPPDAPAGQPHTGGPSEQPQAPPPQNTRPDSGAQQPNAPTADTPPPSQTSRPESGAQQPNAPTPDTPPPSQPDSQPSQGRRDQRTPQPSGDSGTGERGGEED